MTSLYFPKEQPKPRTSNFRAVIHLHRGKLRKPRTIKRVRSVCRYPFVFADISATSII
nr:MAG TPA: hypothetical protein [Inoviridae sp.]